MSKRMVELVKDHWVDPDAVTRVVAIERRTDVPGEGQRSRIYLEGSTTGIPIDLPVSEVMEKLAAPAVRELQTLDMPVYADREALQKVTQAGRLVNVPDLTSGGRTDLVADLISLLSQHHGNTQQQAEAVVDAGFRKVAGQ